MTTTRIPLPQRRMAETFSLRHWNQDWSVTISYYQNSQPGEVFISGAKSGADLEGTARDGAVLLSLCLQYRVPLDVIRGALTRNQDGSASTVVGAVVDKMTHAAAIILLLILLFPATAHAEQCRATRGEYDDDLHWYWRYVEPYDDKKCWYLSRRQLPKSRLHWPKQAEPKPPEKPASRPKVVDPKEFNEIDALAPNKSGPIIMYPELDDKVTALFNWWWWRQ